LSTDAIDEPPSQRNSRHIYHEASIRELADSLRQEGFLQPLCVRPKGSRYELVFGVRRLRAARRAGFAEVPCTIRMADDDRAFLLNAVENLHREHLSNAERVETIERLGATGLGVREISRRTGFNPSTISRWLRINRQPELKAAMESDRIDVARAAILVEAPSTALHELIDRAPKLSAAELRREVGLLRRKNRPASVSAIDRPYLLQALRNLRAVAWTTDGDLLQCIRLELERLSRQQVITPGRRLDEVDGHTSSAPPSSLRRPRQPVRSH
jgi:ParB/RepB/Spo0J family partition protein